MKIKTMTCHDVYNCGASLQAYALQDYLTKQGYEVEIINYKPDYLSFHYRWHWFVNERSPQYMRCRRSVLLRALYVTQRYMKSLATWRRKKMFDSFTRKYLRLTREYDTYLQLCQDPPEADLYIVGSDQVWNNAVLNNGFDPAFFLMFGNRQTRRISFAASFGTSESYMTYITEQYLSLFDGISIREESGSALIGSKFNVQVVCDPVFLLGKSDWERLYLSEYDKYAKEKYILIYNLGKVNQQLVCHAQQLAQDRRMKIFVIKTSENMIFADKTFTEVGPLEFISLFRNASIILSNSFHATAFSLIFKKEFFTYSYQKLTSSSRMIELLNRIGLISRFNPEDVLRIAPLNYEEHNDYCADMIAESEQWLLNQIIVNNND